MDCQDVTFMFQFGLIRDTVTVPVKLLTLKTLKEFACDFIASKLPDNGINRLGDRLLLFRHEYSSPNCLKLINSATDITDEALVEIVLSANPQFINSRNESQSNPVQKPHHLVVNSYRSPAFCDFCGEMLFGLVRQGLKCEGCNLNYHKRCAVKVPNNCTATINQHPQQQRRNSQTPFCTSGSQGGSSGSLNSTTDDQCQLTSATNDQNIGSGANHLAGSFVVPRSTNCQNNVVATVQTGSYSRIGIPHTFVLHTYTRPTQCQQCRKLLHGLFKQGVQCRDCHFNAHKKCVSKVAKDCAGENPILPDLTENLDSSNASSDRDSLIRDDFDEKDGPAIGTLVNFMDEADVPQYLGNNTDRIPDYDSGPDKTPSIPSSLSSVPSSANIPLMRVVQSVKHTKRRDGRAIKEGWLVHFTNKDKTIRRHYWRLDPKSITLFVSDQGSKYYKEIALNEIIAINQARNLKGDLMHCFELRTVNIDYFVGQDPMFDLKDGPTELTLPPPDSGIGAYLAKSWETTIRQALMPVTNTSKSDVTGEPEERITDMSQLYQIFPDDVLGSGQFGIVYGGLHRRTQRAVAIKVIDKLRFPTKQEAQLKNEVAILQNLSHQGVVNLERMFETPERIFVVMEKLKGDMLEMILSHEKGRLSERITKFLITQILIALKHLHSKNIVHCDLKPENVLLSSDSDFPQVKLCDFGFARIIGEKSFRRSVVGTPAYLAPEVLRNKGYNRSLDMWSVGVIIYVSLSGTFPFNEDEDINEQIQNAAFMYPPNPWKEISSEDSYNNPMFFLD
ncbi:serine/threonine-protein kinase D1-like [Ctenocephalides felis]|uniref:serine/threonine-protein kinase D1-like n=1 Tax=Ctenocephalides felis TaxID=7515 RepID=UPI000E6E3636|nr:serine/threonine-protein kinase D1-like [Ctenocephalides felis]